MMPDVILRAAAKAAGLGKYFTGKPCKRGHVCERWTTTGMCVECARIAQQAAKPWVAQRDYMMEWRKNNPDRLERYASLRDKEAQRQYSRDYYSAHKDERNAAKRDYVKRHPEKRRQWIANSMQRNGDAILARRRELDASRPELVAKWRETTWAAIRSDPVRLEEYRKKARDNYQANRDAIIAYHSEYAKKNPLKMKQWGHARRARLLGAPGRGVSEADVVRMLDEQDHCCAYCFRRAKKMALEHVVSLMSGGAHDPCNTLMACHSCNSKKRDKPLSVFLARLHETLGDVQIATESDIQQLLAAPWRVDLTSRCA